MSPRDQRPLRDDRRRDELIQALLDAGGGATRADFERLRTTPGACEELARLRGAVARLTAPVETPDLTDAILDRVDSRRRFLAPRRRRLVTAGRAAVAAGVVGAVGLASFVQRAAPQFQASAPAAPVSRIVEATGGAAPAETELAERTVDTIQSSLASPVARLSLSPTFRPGQGLKFDLAVPDIPGPPRPQPGAVFAGSYGPESQAPLLRAQDPATAQPPFIDRFDALLVIFRDPPAQIDDEIAELDDR